MLWGDIVVSLAERVAGLALWQGLAVDPDLCKWGSLANGLDIRADELRPILWDRCLGAQGGRTIPMSGYLGALDIARPPERLMPLLALGETRHLGG
ncbi:MAG: hypothetical protein VYD57_14035 [Pseudomonadota bacterium]|nr:hypothetical protein [Pseudomonadota bacterium]